MGSRYFVAAAILVYSLSMPSRTRAAAAGDHFLAGYVTAVLKLQYHLRPVRLVVRNGAVKLTLAKIPPREMVRIKKSLLAVAGVGSVSIRNAAAVASAQAPRTTAARGGLPTAAITTPPIAPRGVTIPPATSGNSTPASLAKKYRIRFSPPAWRNHGDWYRLPTGFLPSGRLFEPLLADPKWPGFSAAYAHYSPYHPTGLKDVAAVSIGDTIPVYRGDLPGGWQAEGGIQADIYAYFNTDTGHNDLQNADYFVGGYGAFRHRHLSFIIRYFHQSSHLGDEFLLANPAYYFGLRQKISYEELNGIVSLDLLRRLFRVYGGAGCLGDVEPGTLGRWIFQYGAEFHGPVLWRTTNTAWNPIAGVDCKNWSQNNYDTDISLRAGLQATKGRPDSPRLQFLLEFFTGHSYYGQFFANKIQYFGFGVHFYF